MKPAKLMRDMRDEEGRLRSFEISSWLGRKGVAVIVRTIPGATLIRSTSGFSWWIIPNRDETVCEFELAGIRFVVTEDFGDSDRYWIGPKDYGTYPETETIKAAFVKPAP